MMSAILKSAVISGDGGDSMQTSDVHQTHSGGRQIALAVLALAILVASIYLLDVIPISVAYSIACAAALYAVSYVWSRASDGKTEQEGPGRFTRDVLFSTLRMSLFALAVIFLIKVKPDLTGLAISQVWPLLGPAIYIFAASIQSVLKARLSSSNMHEPNG